MRVKPANPDHAVGLIDPHTKRSPFLAIGQDGKVVVGEDGKPVVCSADVPDNNFWTRRLMKGEVVRVEDAKPADKPATVNPVGETPTSQS